jgi:hypothetical protein
MRHHWLSLLALAFASCGTSSREGTSYDFGAGDGGPGSDGSASMPDGARPSSCLPTDPDLSGCDCGMGGMSRSCYPASADPATRGVGACRDGMQVCMAAGEFSSYGSCTGAVTPVTESCTNQIDDNCDGKIDCADPTCATNPSCGGGCTNGATRPCYDGPMGTLGVGTCAGGMQVCTNGQWPTDCPGEVRPAQEDCTDAKDHDCDHLPGCLDLLDCIFSPACQGNCTNPDNGCVCPMGAGDTATCPEGYIGVDSNGFPPVTECCPCTAQTCGNPGCCAEPVCAGNQACNGYTCKPLPQMCNGMVNADCDDFPEDCDEPCCKCTNCP